MARIPPFRIIDDFLDDALHGAILARALGHQADFAPSAVLSDEGGGYDTQSRQSSRCSAGLGPLKAPLVAAVEAAREGLCAALGIPAFDVSLYEVELVAHRDGAFFEPHIDIMIQARRDQMPSDRIVTLVWYFHAQPQRFSGGELALLPLGPGEPVLIEVRDNRLLAFPSFAMHEVRTVSVPGDRFADARFAVNVWLHRARAA